LASRRPEVRALLFRVERRLADDDVPPDALRRYHFSRAAQARSVHGPQEPGSAELLQHSLHHARISRARAWLQIRRGFCASQSEQSSRIAISAAACSMNLFIVLLISL